MKTQLTREEIVRKHLFLSVSNSTEPLSEFSVPAKPSAIYDAMEEYLNQGKEQVVDPKIIN
jgi:hypothetical protein